jgi:hypothetical protein
MSLTYDELTLSADAYSSQARAHVTPPAYTRVYRFRGREAHLREAACRTAARYRRDYDGWLGTGSQAEYEHAAALPLCAACFAWREVTLDDERLGIAHGTEMT